MDRENRYSKFAERDKLVDLLNTMTSSNSELLLYRQKLIDINKRKKILLENVQASFSPVYFHFLIKINEYFLSISHY